MNQEFELQINNNNNLSLNQEDAQNLDAIPISKNKWHILTENQSYHAEIIQSDLASKSYKIEVNSNIYEVNIKDTLDLQIKAMGFSAGNSKKLNLIKAPMPGIIIDVLVKEKDNIKEGETLLVLEAMKMENGITCPKDATIKAIHVENAETVEKGKLLIELE